MNEENSQKRVVLVLNSELEDPIFYHNVLTKADYIIAVDGGANQTRKLGITPHLIIGDMDSISDETYKKYQKEGCEFVIFPSNKDKSDSQLAVDYAIENNYEKLDIIGWEGGRFDHYLSNILLLANYDSEEVKMRLLSPRNEAYILNGKSIFRLRADGKRFVSIIPISSVVEKLNIKNMKYSLTNKNIYRGDTLGLSNEFLDESIEGEVSFEKGVLLLIKSND